jgi:hypothetical protein
MFEKGGERLSVLYTGYQVMFEKERQRDFRFCILVTRWYLRKRERDTFDFAYPGNQYTKPKVSLSLFLKYHLVTSIQNRVSLSLSFKYHLVTSIQNWKSPRWYLKKRKRETFGFAYWLPDDIWKRERDFRFCILVTRWCLNKRERER